MKIIFPLLIFLTTTLISCGGDRNPASDTITTTSLADSLPNGRWQGTGRATDSNGTDNEVEIVIQIEDNVIVNDFHSGGHAGTSVDKLRYTKKGHAEWLDASDTVIGECQCFSKTCHCITPENAQNQHQMTISFPSKSGQNQREMHLEQSGSINQVKYHNVYQLFAN